MKKRIYTLTIAAVITSSIIVSNTNPLLAITLDDALKSGLINSLQLDSAKHSWSAAREAIGVSTSTSDFSTTFSSTGSYSQTDSKTGSGYKSSDTNSSSITLSKNIYDGGQTHENVVLAEINLEIAAADYINSEQNVILTTAKSYLNVRKSHREVKLHTANLERLVSHVEAVRIKVDAGVDTPTRLSEALARLARAKSDTILSKTSLIKAAKDFHSLTKLKILKVEETFIQSQAVSIKIKSALDAEFLAKANHPTILKAKANEKAATQSFRTLAAKSKPTLALSISGTTSPASDNFKASLTFSSPIFATNSSNSTARKTAALHSKSKIDLREALRTVSINAHAAFYDWETNALNLDAVKSEISAARLVAKGISNEVRIGRKTSLDLLDAEKEVNDSELRLVSAEHDQILAAYTLKAALGQLTAINIGLGDVLEDISQTSEPKSPVSTVFPFRLD